MSATWDAHFKQISDLIAANPVPKYTKPAPAEATPGPSWEDLLRQSGILSDPWQGGMNAGGFGAPSGPPGDMGKMFGDISPGTIGGLLGAFGGGLALGPVGGLLGGLAGRGIAGLLSGSAPAQAAMAGETFGGGAGPGTFGGGLGDIGAAGMGLGLGGLGAMSGNEIMGW